MRLTYLIFLISFLVLFSCTSDQEKGVNSKKEDKVDTTVAMSPIDTIMVDTFAVNEEIIPRDLTAAQQSFFDDTIVNFLKKEEVDYLFYAMEFRRKLVSVQLVHEYYTSVLPKIGSIIDEAMYISFPDVIYSGDDEPAIGWRSISKFIPELYTDCPCSECSSMAYVNLIEMSKLAEKTPGEEDDYFFMMEEEIHNGYFIGETYDKDEMPILATHSSGFYILDHCDICSYQSFGNDFHYLLFQYITSHEWDIFKSEVEEYFHHDYLQGDQLVFYYDKEDVIVEMHDILTLPIPKDYQNIIQDAVSRVKLEKDVFFGCQNLENNCPTP